MTKVPTRKAKKQHHVFVFRHCFRAAGMDKINQVGKDFDHDYSQYFGSLPKWDSELGTCLPSRTDVTEAVGKWMVTGGLINVDEKAKWEIFADDELRDSATALHMARGIKSGLWSQGLYRDAMVGLGDIHATEGFLFMNEGIPQFDKKSKSLENEQREQNIAHLPRPDLDFGEAVALIQQLAGVGKLGNLSHEEKLYNVHIEGTTPTGAAALVNFFARQLFYSRAGEVDPSFAPNATVRQIMQLVQYIHWTKLVELYKINSSARYGAFLAHTVIQVLRHGSFLPWEHQAPFENLKIYNDDTTMLDYKASMIEDRPVNTDDGDDNHCVFDCLDDDEFDTKVTILLGHNYELSLLATVLGAKWSFNDPYLPSDVIPTSPLTAMHFVRHLEEDKIELSVVYPNIIDTADPDFNMDKPYFPINTSGIMERVPMLLEGDSPHYSAHKHTAQIQSAYHSLTSSDVLEQHILVTLESYGEKHMYALREKWYMDWVNFYSPAPGTKESFASFSPLKGGAATRTVLFGGIFIFLSVLWILYRKTLTRYHHIPPTTRGGEQELSNLVDVNQP